MKIVQMICAGLGLTLLGGPTSAFSQESPQTPEKDAHAPGAHAEDGAALYARYCALCHGADREGYAADHAPSLRSKQLMGSAPGSYLWTSISYGRPNTAMAAFQDSLGGPLSHDAQHALMDWLLEESGHERTPVEDTPVVGTPANGATVYTRHCAECHGARGEGGTGTALANPVFLATASDAFIRHTIAHGRDGTPMKAYVDAVRDSNQ